MQRILAGEIPDMELAALLGAMAGRGETAAEIAGFAQLLRTMATPLPLSEDERATIVDTCGTGGDGSGTFNISTAAALVAAAAGAQGRQARQPGHHLALRLGRRAGSPRHPDRTRASSRGGRPSQARLLLPPRARASSGPEGPHAHPPRHRRAHHPARPRAAAEPRRRPPPGHGRLLRPPGAAGRRRPWPCWGPRTPWSCTATRGWMNSP